MAPVKGWSETIETNARQREVLKIFLAVDAFKSPSAVLNLVALQRPLVAANTHRLPRNLGCPSRHGGLFRGEVAAVKTPL